MKAISRPHVSSRTAVLAVCLAVAGSSANAAREGAEVLPDAANAIVGGVQWEARTFDTSAGHTLYIQPLAGGSRRVLKQFNGRIQDFKVSPKGDLVAVKEFVSERNVPANRANVVRTEYVNGREVEFYDYLDTKVVIVGMNGSILGSIPAVYRFSWDPKGEQIAYVSGIEDENGELRSTGTWIYDTRTQEAKRIHSAGSDVVWAGWDGNVYINGPVLSSGQFGVARYEVSMGRTIDTPHSGIYFSPDGRYYFRGPSEGDPGGEVFLTAGDAPVKLDMAIEEVGRKGRAIVRGWFGPRQVIAASAIPGAQVDYLIDVVTGSKQRLNGEMLESKGGGDLAWILRAGAISESVSR